MFTTKKLFFTIVITIVIVTAVAYSSTITHFYSISTTSAGIIAANTNIPNLKTINIETETSVTLKSINFLFLGVPGPEYAAPWLTDTIIIGSFYENNNKVSLVSIPRDLIIKIPESENITKINALYSLGKTFSPTNPIKFIKEKITEITGLKIDYYALIDVTSLEQLIDSLGGVNIMVANDISDPRFPGKHYSYDPFYLSAGFHTLNGHDAVRFARSRYSKRGDFDRIARQRQLLQAIKSQIATKKLNLQWLIKTYSDLNERIKTNIAIDDLPVLFKAMHAINGKNINDYSLEIGPNGLLKETSVFLGGTKAYAITPKSGLSDYEKIKKFFADLAL